MARCPRRFLRMRQGDTVTVRVTNRLSVPSSIHWHGMIVPADMDGVPGLSFEGIAAGATLHVPIQGQSVRHLLVPLPLAVPGTDRSLRADHRGARGGERHHSDREHTVLLSDWTDSDPEHIYATLKRESDYFNFGQHTVGDFLPMRAPGD